MLESINIFNEIKHQNGTDIIYNYFARCMSHFFV